MDERRGKQTINKAAPRPRGTAEGNKLRSSPSKPYKSAGEAPQSKSGVGVRAKQNIGGSDRVYPIKSQGPVRKSNNPPGGFGGKTAPSAVRAKKTKKDMSASGRGYRPEYYNNRGRPAAAAGRGRTQTLPQHAKGTAGRGAGNSAALKADAQRAEQLKRKQSGGLRAQTAAERRRHIEKRRGLTPEQAEYIRRRREIKRYYIKKRRISSITLFFTRLTTLLVIYVVLFSVTSGLFILSLISSGVKSGDDVVYQIGENRRDYGYRVETLKYKERVHGGQLFLNFTQLAEYLEFVTTGDISELKYLTKYTGGEEVIFEVGMGTVSVNGSMTRMSVPSYYKDGIHFVPIDFVETYIKGISVGINEDNGRLVLYRLYTLNAKNEKIFMDVTFTLKPQVPSDNIDENSLPVDIKLLTEPSRVQQLDMAGNLTG